MILRYFEKQRKIKADPCQYADKEDLAEQFPELALLVEQQHKEFGAFIERDATREKRFLKLYEYKRIPRKTYENAVLKTERKLTD